MQAFHYLKFRKKSDQQILKQSHIILHCYVTEGSKLKLGKKFHGSGRKGKNSEQ